jgi:hypothetical protein
VVAREDAIAEREGLRRFLAGEQVGASTNIAEEPSYGYGRLDGLGFWEFPVPAALVALRCERDRLDGLVNAPEIFDFAQAVVLEAAHQRERWPSGHDANKTDEDWFWLIGYLAGKALHNPPHPTVAAIDKQLHRIITIAAAAANWHAARLAAGSADRIVSSVRVQA